MVTRRKSHLLFNRNNQARVGEAAWNKGTTVYFWRGVTGMLFLFTVAILFTSVPKSGVHGTLHITTPPPCSFYFSISILHISSKTATCRLVALCLSQAGGVSINQRVDSDVSALHVVGFLASKMFVMRSEACCCFY